MDIVRLIGKAAQAGASDLHLVCGSRPRIRVDGKLTDTDEPVLTHEETELLIRTLAGERLPELEEAGELDTAADFGDGIRCRLNLFRQQGHWSAVFRLLRRDIPSLETLGLPPVIATFAEFRRGLVIVTGETGSGKSTTLAALLDRLNHSRDQHILTLEDPIEYVYSPDRCTVNQREVGSDTASFASGLKAALREDPDIILLGELRDPETIETALTAAETGHLVFTTLHTGSAPDTIDRIVGVFPGEKQPQVRLQLSTTLRAVLAQQLLPARGGGRAAACEVMIPNDAIRSLIREAKTPQIRNALQTSAAEGNILMDTDLIRLARAGRIAAETAVSAAHDPETMARTLGVSMIDRMRRR